MNLVEILNSMKAGLSGLQVLFPGGQGMQPVPVGVGVPEGEIDKQRFPFLAVHLVDAIPDYRRWDSGEQHFGLDPVTYDIYQKRLPQPYNLMFQIEGFSKFGIHDVAMMEHVLRTYRRETYLEVGSATLAAPVTEDDASISLVDATGFGLGDILVLDPNTGLLSHQRPQAFFVLGAATDGGVLVDPPARRDFAAGTTDCYKARYEVVFQGMFYDDGYSSGRPYVRRVFSYDVWGHLDLDAVEQITAVRELRLDISEVKNITNFSPPES